MFLKQLQVGHMAVFAYIIGDTESGDGIVVDPGADIDAILWEAQNNGINIKYIINTHGHVDHIAGNAELKEKTGAKIIIHESDADMMVSHPFIIMRMFRAKPSPPADVRVNDGDTIELGTMKLEVIHTPGHSPGSMSLYTQGYVLTGDTLLVESVGSTNLIGSSREALYSSIREKLLTLPDDTVVLPGHNIGGGLTSTIEHEKVCNPFLQRL
ncbi:MAG: MBL fold metallo-hydrolase [Deltaproteobacteria bacterium]|nr:MBL fold metallo-hydrolase [Deltaproteobacteria bacterium]